MDKPEPCGPTIPTGRRQSRAGCVADHLDEMASQVAPGTRLGTKREVRERCGVSVGTFNEALKLVDVRGTIVLRPGPGGGLFAQRPSPMVRLGNSVLALVDAEEVVRDAMRLRDAIDPLVVEDAITHHTPADLRSMEQCLRDMASSQAGDDSLAFVRGNWELHRAIARAAPDSIIGTIYLHLLDILEEKTFTVRPGESDDQPLSAFIADRHRLHVEIVEAIADRDRARAASLMARHATSDTSTSRESD